MKKVIVLGLFLMWGATAKSQVLISILLGDKLNSGKIEFGLEGGFNRSYLQEIEEAKGRTNFNLGFYFNILMQEKLYLETGVLVKSNVGANGIKPYSTGVPELDVVFSDGGEVQRKLSYFYVPIYLQYRFDSHFYISAGPQLGLMSKAVDTFVVEENGGDLEYSKKNTDLYNRIDAGVGVNLGYRLLQGLGMSFGVKYYQGLTNIYKDSPEKITNSSLNFYVRIPIGKGKANKKKTEIEE